MLWYCGAETRRHCSLKDRQLHRKKKDQEQMELQTLYMVLHQLGLGILTYEIQAEGGSTHIVHQN